MKENDNEQLGDNEVEESELESRTKYQSYGAKLFELTQQAYSGLKLVRSYKKRDKVFRITLISLLTIAILLISVDKLLTDLGLWAYRWPVILMLSIQAIRFVDLVILNRSLDNLHSSPRKPVK